MTEQSTGKTIQDAISGIHPVILDTQYTNTSCRYCDSDGQWFVSVARFDKLHDPDTYTYLVHKENDTELFTVDIPKDVADRPSGVSSKTRPHFEIFRQRRDKNYTTEVYHRWLESTFVNGIVVDPDQRGIYYFVTAISIANSNTTVGNVKLSDDYPYVIELREVNDSRQTRVIDFMTFARWIHAADPKCFAELFTTK